MNRALNVATHETGVVSWQDRTSLAHLERFLPSGERLIWVGGPQLSRLLLRAISLTAFMALIGSIGAFLLLQDITQTDVCGADPGKACRRLYGLPFVGLIAAASYTPLLWLSVLAHSSGLLREFYGLTEMQAIKLCANPFDRFQSVNLGKVAEKRIGVRKRFGTVLFGSVAFFCLCEKDAKAIARSRREARNFDPHPQKIPTSGTPT